MTSTKDNPKKFSDLWCGQRKRPSAFIIFNCVGHLRVALLFNLLKIKDYERKTSRREPIICIKLVY